MITNSSAGLCPFYLHYIVNNWTFEIEMLFVKDLARLTLLFPAMLAILPLRLLHVRLVYVDSTRLGHFFCDLHLYAQTLEKTSKEVYLVPLGDNSIQSIDDYLPEYFRTIRSPILAKFTGWFRHFSFLVVNVTNSHTHVNDVWLFRKKHLKNRYCDLTKHFSPECFLQPFQGSNKFFIQGDYIAFHWRSGWDNDEEQSFRNTDYSVAKQICSSFLDLGYNVVNLGAEPITLQGVQNPRLNKDFDEADILRVIYNSVTFVGDSSGPTMVALLYQKPSLLFDIFPPEIFPLNNKSLVHYANIRRAEEMEHSVNLNEFTNDFTCLTKGSELGLHRLILKKLSHSNVEDLIDEFVSLNLNGPNAEQRRLQRCYSNKFNVKQNAGYLSCKFKPDYL